jgi:hypothetical protein
VKELAQLAGDERREILIRGATEEGKLSFYTSTAPEDIQSLLMAFEMRYPFIRAEMVRDKGVAIRERFTQECRGGGSPADVVEVNDINLGKPRNRDCSAPTILRADVYPPSCTRATASGSRAEKLSRAGVESAPDRRCRRAP